MRVRVLSGVWLINLDIIRFIPIMVARIVISLKKAAGSRQTRLGPEVPNRFPIGLQDTYPSRAVEGIPLGVFRSQPHRSDPCVRGF